jgi:hypothetical protein
MRTSAKALAFSAVMLTLPACGGLGSIDGPDAGGPGGDSDAGPGYTAEGGVGNGQCPALSQVDDGLSCDVNGLQCPASQPVYDCHGAPLATPHCVCDGESWTCEDLVPTDNCSSPGSSCPAPEMLIPGAKCDGSITQSCVTLNLPMDDCDGGAVSTKAVCTCGPAGSWICPPIATVTCTGPAMAPCPDPNSIVAGEPCKGDTLLCPGNPTNCDGQTFYDGFECEGFWVGVSTTSCSDNSDAGFVVDASVQDASPSFDASPAAD